MTAKIFLLLLLVLTLGCINTKPPETKYPAYSTTTTLDELTILKIATQSSEVKEFTSRNPKFQYTITTLKSADTKKFAEKYPALYGNLPNKTLYQAEYKYGNEGILVILDLENEKILKHFITTGVSLN